MAVGDDMVGAHGDQDQDQRPVLLFVFIALFATEFSHFVISGWPCSAFRGRWHWTDGVAALCRSLCSRTTCQKGHGKLSVVEKLVREEMREVCLRRLTHYMSMVRCVCMLASIAYASTKHMSSLNVTLEIKCSIVTLWAITLFAAIFPNFVNKRTANLWYIALAVMKYVLICIQQSASFYAVWGRHLNIVMIVQSCHCSELWLVGLDFFATMICRLFVGYSVASHDHLAGGISNWVFNESFAFVTTGVAIAAIRLMDMDRLKQRFDSEVSRLNTGAMARLLELMCDVVVELDEKCHVAEPAPKLSALLMLDPRRTLHGQPFGEFMPFQEDACRFESLALASLQGPSGSMPGAMSATLQGPGALMPV
eukprot:CAMPEP_0198503630 /NCGR_PEP_ID=MMETSP1462-20131121/10019_1 /TAXON_ID=1333877 /ORGANISM="Brandtodinium nutriculum, Strain RCC3387" /LENGTH=365 /DNA_ID=CAMNT_0044232763 /DNA_START=159 /DNA_END=1252 /DNA_ORIENTATION=+